MNAVSHIIGRLKKSIAIGERAKKIEKQAVFSLSANTLNYCIRLANSPMRGTTK
jgi:hypothetical protein